jgi:hypothetical protein
LQAQLKTAPAATLPKFLIELAKSPQEKLFLKNFQRLKKIKHPPHKPDKKALDK